MKVLFSLYFYLDMEGDLRSLCCSSCRSASVWQLHSLLIILSTRSSEPSLDSLFLPFFRFPSSSVSICYKTFSELRWSLSNSKQWMWENCFPHLASILLSQWLCCDLPYLLLVIRMTFLKCFPLISPKSNLTNQI